MQELTPRQRLRLDDLKDFLSRLDHCRMRAIEVRSGWKVQIGCGICDHVRFEVTNATPLYNIYQEVQDRARHWEHWSGDWEYPVPGPDGGSARDWFYSSREDFDDNPRTMWVGEYGDMRMRLLDFLIEDVTKELL